MDKRHAELIGSHEQDGVCLGATPELECVRQGITPEQDLVRLGFRILEKPLSVGAARILARVDLRARTVCLDMGTVIVYAQEQGIGVEQMRQQALAHELGHVLNPHLRGHAAEQAAQACADQWLLESRGGE